METHEEKRRFYMTCYLVCTERGIQRAKIARWSSSHTLYHRHSYSSYWILLPIYLVLRTSELCESQIRPYGMAWDLDIYRHSAKDRKNPTKLMVRYADEHLEIGIGQMQRT